MIKSVTIQNFESHEDTTIDFCDGMNSIVGLSNSGKSSCIRALQMVVNNEWNKDMVRNGYEFCRVRIVTERGWVEAERGEKVNRWRCQEGDNDMQFYQKVGTGVPDLATKILGMGKRERGNGITELPNFQSQLEKHYMLSEVGDKKASSNIIAVMMDNAIGLGGMEDLIKDFSADLLKDRKWLNEKQEEIADIKTVIVDEKIFSQYNNDVDAIGSMSDNLESMDGDIETADKYMTRYEDARERKIESENKSNAIPETKEMEALSEELSILNDKLERTEKMAGIENRLNKSALLSTIDSDRMADLLERCGRLDESIKICGKALDCDKKITFVSGILAVDNSIHDEVVGNVASLNETIARAEKDLSNARELWKRQLSAAKESKSLATEMKDAEAELEELKKELGVCPLCGNKL